jgi:hypothetical protein
MALLDFGLMKRISSGAISVLAAFVMLNGFSIEGVQNEQDGSANLVLNGSLEKEEKNGFASGWAFSGQMKSAELDESDPVDGSFSQRMDGIAKGSYTMIQKVAVPASTEFLFTAYVKSEEKVVARIGRLSMSYHKQGEWQKISGLVHSGAATELTISFYVGGMIDKPVSTWIDHVVLRPVERPKLAPRKSYGKTMLVEDGKSNVYIVYPSSGENAKLAKRLRDAIARRTGLKIPIVSDVEATEIDRPVLRGTYEESHLILIGRLGINRAIWPAYNRFLSAADGYYPGGDGYVVRTAANVLRNGKNHIILGGSSDVGFKKAVERFIKIIEKTDAQPDGSFVLPWQLDVELGGKCKETFEAENRLWVEESLNRKLHYTSPPNDPGYGKVRTWYQNAMGYYWTGWPGYRQRAIEYIGPVLDDRAHTHQYLIEFFIRAYDMLDDSDLFTPEQRSGLDDLIFKNFWTFLTGPDLGWMTTFSPPYDDIGLTNRHSIAPWMADLKMAQFFHEYFELKGDVKELVEFRFSEKLNFFKHLVDERWGSSQPLLSDSEHEEEIVASLFRSALDYDFYEFFNSDNARRALSLDRINHLNGAMMWPGGRIDHPLTLGILAHYYQDGRYLALLNKSRGVRRTFQNRYDNGVHRYVPGSELAPTSLETFTGVRVPPVMPHTLNHLHWLQYLRYQLPKIDPEQALNFVSFRSGFDKNDDYVAIHGMNACYPPGVFITFTSRGVNWFSAWSMGNFAPTTSRYFDHNAVSVVRTDRWSDQDKPYSAVAEKEWTANFNSSGGVAFTLDPFMSTRWQRQIIWIQPGLYVVRDTVTALEEGEFNIAVNWKPVGKPSWDGATWTSTKRNAQLHITPLDDSFRVDQNVDEQLAGRAEKLQFRQATSAKLSADESVTSTTVLQALLPDKEAAYKSRLIGSDMLLLEPDGADAGPILVCWESTEKLAIDSDAAVVIVKPGSIKVIKTTRLVIDGQTIIHTPAPVSVSLNLATGESIVDSDAEISIVSDDLEKISQTLAAKVAAIAQSHQVTKNIEQPQTDQMLEPEDNTRRWKLAWSYDGMKRPTRITAAKRISNEIIDLGSVVKLTGIQSKRGPLPEKTLTAVPDKNGGIPALDSQQWKTVEQRPEWLPRVRTGNYGRATLEKKAYQALYPDDLRARYVRAPGEYELTFYDGDRLSSRSPVRLEVDDLDNDGKTEIFAVSDMWPLFINPGRSKRDESWAILRPDGSQVSQHTGAVNLQTVRLLDIDGSGRKRIVQAGIDAQLHIFEPDGSLMQHIDLYQMHQRFNETDGRPNTRHPAGLYTMPYSIGLWRPNSDGRQKIVISRYCAFSFIDDQSQFEGVLMDGGYVTPGLLEYGIDFDGDGTQEQVCLTSGTILHIDGDDTPTVRDPGGDMFYPQVYSYSLLAEPDAPESIEGARVILFEPLPWKDAPTPRYLMVIRENYLAVYDGKLKKWAFSWVPDVQFSTAAIVQAGPQTLRIIAITKDNLLWQIDWRDQLGKVEKFTTRPLGRQINSIAVSPNDPNRIILAGKSGLYLLDDQQNLSIIATGSYHDAKWLNHSVTATTTDGQVVRLDPVTEK